MFQSVVSKICRLCLIEDNSLLSLFGSNMSNSTIIDLVKSTLNLEIAQNNQLPDKICTKCFLVVSKFRSFIDQCRMSEELLKSEIVSIPTNINDPEKLLISEDEDCFIVDKPVEVIVVNDCFSPFNDNIEKSISNQHNTDTSCETPVKSEQVAAQLNESSLVNISIKCSESQTHAECIDLVDDFDTESYHQQQMQKLSKSKRRKIRQVLQKTITKPAQMSNLLFQNCKKCPSRFPKLNDHDVLCNFCKGCITEIATKSRKIYFS